MSERHFKSGSIRPIYVQPMRPRDRERERERERDREREQGKKRVEKCGRPFPVVGCRVHIYTEKLPGGSPYSLSHCRAEV